MVPDRNDNAPDVGDDENGVLADATSIDTTAITIFGSTEHVSVSLPVGSADDDLDTDEAVDDILAGEIAVGDLPVDSVPAIDVVGAEDAVGAEIDEAEAVDAEIVDAEIVEAEIVDEEPAGETPRLAEPDANPEPQESDDAYSDSDAHAHTQDEPAADAGAQVDDDPQAHALSGDDTDTHDVASAQADGVHGHAAAETGDADAETGDADAHEVDRDDAAPDADTHDADTDDIDTHEDHEIDLVVVDDVEPADASAEPVGTSTAPLDAYAAFAAAGFDVTGLDVEDDGGEARDLDAGSMRPEDMAVREIAVREITPREITPREVAPDEVAPDEVARHESGTDDEGATAVEEVKPVTDPLTRSALRQAMAEIDHVDDATRAEDAERVHESERITVPRQEVALTSKRVGEFEPDRESADLLTADRLLDHSKVGRAEPEGRWQHFVYSISGRRINLGDGKRARDRKELDRRISAPLVGGARFVPVLSRKGGVGKTTITTLLGMALADARDDRVIAIDGNPDRGTLAERISRPSGRTVRDLARLHDSVSGYNDISTIVARDETRLDVIASDADPHVSEAFSDHDYRDVATVAAHYYSLVLTDTGTGIVHSVMGATLEMADELVVVSGLSVDEARLASETLTWLETNGFADKVRKAVVVLNNARPGSPLVLPDELEAHFRSRVRAVVRMPYDPHIGAGSAITFRELEPATREAARRLAAIVIEGLRSLDAAA